MSNPPRSELLEEAGPVYRPTLASYIGDNEAIFLSQLDFILRKRETNIKHADGKRWYRQKPREFALFEFPGWGEAKVKRTINNLRNDGLLLARSDLNDDGSRSLWYTINYHAVNGLTGPVYRLQTKSKKLTKASRSREIYSDDYTKDQNDLISQKSTNNQQKAGPKTDIKDQNDPIPKDHFDLTYKESFKNKDITPNGVSGEPQKAKPESKPESKPGPLKQLMGTFTTTANMSLPHKKSDQGFWWSEIREIKHIVNGDLELGKKLIRETIEDMRGEDLTISSPKSIVNMLRAKCAARASPNGYHIKLTPEEQAALEARKAEAMRQ